MKPTTTFQWWSLWLGHSFAWVSLALVLWWAGGSDTDANFLGGYGWSESKEFNLHPVFMITGMVVMNTEAILAYRTIPMDKVYVKAFHMIVQLIAVVLICCGLAAVWQYENEEHYGNLDSLHSWLGIMTVTLFFANFVGGIGVFYNPLVPGSIRGAYLPVHIFVGLFVYVLACFTSCSGIQEENVWLGCAYTIEHHDVNPAAHYTDIPLGCRVSNGLAFVIFLCCFFTLFALVDVKVSPSSDEALHPDEAKGLLGKGTKEENVEVL